jgi:hypothetical protein
MTSKQSSLWAQTEMSTVSTKCMQSSMTRQKRLMATIDGFVAWKTKKFLRMNTKLAKIIYEMVATETNPRRPVAGITFPHKRCQWRLNEDARSRRSRSLDVVDVVVHLTISRSCTRRHNWRHLSTRSHVRLVVVSSMLSVQQGSGRRDPPDTPTLTYPSV